MAATAVTAIPLVGLVTYAAADRYNVDKARATSGAATKAELYAALAGELPKPSLASEQDLAHLVKLVPLQPGSVLDVYRDGGFAATIGTRRGNPPADDPSLRAAVSRGSGTFTVRGADGTERVWGVASVKGTPVKIVFGQPGSSVYGPAEAALRRDILLVFLVSALAVGAAFMVAARMTAPIRRLAARVGGRGDSANDIAVLERGIDRLDEAIEESKVELARRAERLEALNEELEDRVQRRTDQLEQANQELEAFSYSVSHDLRAPLRAIDGFSRIVSEDYAADLPAEAQRYLGLVAKNTEDMGRLIDGLLAFSKLGHQPLDKRRLDVEALVHDVVAGIEAEQNGHASPISIGTLPEANADPILLRQVFANLLSNAVKFTRDTTEPRIEVESEQAGGAPVYVVRDNGVGFDMRYADKLFTVFQRLHRAEDYGGTGIGLALVSRIVSRHGGRIWAEGAPGEGATFYFTLEEGTS